MTSSRDPDAKIAHATTAVILAAGKGTRMNSERPKVLHELCGRSMLRHVIDAAREAGASRILVVVGHDRDRVLEAFPDDDLVWVVQEPQAGTGHALAVAREAVGDAAQTLLLLYGDVPLIRAAGLRDLLEAHRESGNRLTVVTTHVDNPTGYGRILRDDAGSLRAIREQIDVSPEEAAVTEINTGIYALEAPQVFDVLERVKPNERKGEVYLTDVVGLLREDDEPVDAWCSPDADDFRGVNSRGDLAGAAETMRARILDRHMENGVTVVDPKTTYVDVDVEIGRDTVLHPCTVIRDGVRIGEGCEIGPFAHLRVGTSLADGAAIGNFTETKNTTLGPGAKAKHLTYLGDATVGRGANIGAGTITANYDGSKKSPTHIGDGAFIGSGTVLVAPADVGDRGVTGAGAIVTRGSKVGADEVYVGVPARKLERGAANRKAANAAGSSSEDVGSTDTGSVGTGSGQTGD